jgi:hypothetical protein
MKAHIIFGAAATVIGALAPIGSRGAMAATPGSLAAMSTAGADPAISEAAMVKELERRLDERDAVIRDLMQRVDRLERAQAQQTAQASGVPPQPARSGPPAPAVAQAAPPPAGGAPGGGPGLFTVSEEAAERALERALVQTGAALLPRGKMELAPSLFYQYQRISTPGQIAVTADGNVFITENVLRSSWLQGSLEFRLGLPWGMQVELGAPYVYKENTVATRVGGAGLSRSAPSAHGFGNPSITLLKQVLLERDGRPGLFVNVGWTPDIAKVSRGIPLGQGFNQWSTGFTVVKRQDPLVYTGGFTYVRSGQNNGVRPGDQYVASAGVILAVSPETSLQFGQQLIFYEGDAFGGRTIPGSRKTGAVFTAGLLSILGRNRVVNLTLGIGETQDSPDFLLRLSMPIRLN